MTWLRSFGAIRYLRYVAVSAVALLTDLALFSALLAAGLAAVPASVLGYGLGIVVHWLLSSRLVFTDAVAPDGPERIRQKALFVSSAVIGLALTTAIMSGGTILRIEPHLAKLVAIIVSFQATYLARRVVVFRT